MTRRSVIRSCYVLLAVVSIFAATIVIRVQPLEADAKDTSSNAVTDVATGSLMLKRKKYEFAHVIAFEEFRPQHEDIVINVIFTQTPIPKNTFLVHLENDTVFEENGCFGLFVQLTYDQEGELIACQSQIPHGRSFKGRNLSVTESPPELDIQRTSGASRVSGKVQLKDSEEGSSFSATFSSELLAGKKVVAEKKRLAAQTLLKQGQVDGKVVLGGKTYELTHAVAYETNSPAYTYEEVINGISSNVGQKDSVKTCVLLCCENVQVKELMTSLVKDDNDFGMRLNRPFVRVYFDGSGKPSTFVISKRRDSKTWVGKSGSPLFPGDLVGECQVKEGRVSGTCSINEEASPSKERQFNATFEVELVHKVEDQR